MLFEVFDNHYILFVDRLLFIKIFRLNFVLEIAISFNPQLSKCEDFCEPPFQVHRKQMALLRL